MSRRDQLLQEVRIFHQQHPEVWDLFVKFAFQKINAGFAHYSARGIWHRIRWETEVPTDTDPLTFKLSNNHTPFYARAFMKKYPAHQGFFRTRTQPSGGGKAVTLPALQPGNFI